MTIAVSCSASGIPEKFICFQVEECRVRGREVLETADDSTEGFCRQLNSLNVDLLIVGHLRREVELAIFDSGINLISGINGNADEILSDYLKGSLHF